jgi:hypothetical protein
VVVEFGHQVSSDTVGLVTSGTMIALDGGYEQGGGCACCPVFSDEVKKSWPGIPVRRMILRRAQNHKGRGVAFPEVGVG